MRVLLLTKALAVSLIATLVACGQNGSTTLNKPKSFYSKDQVLVVDTPAGWRQAELHPYADLEIEHVTKDLGLVVLSDPAAGLVISLQEYSDDTRIAIHETVSNMEEFGPREMTIHGQPAIQYAIRGTMRGATYICLHTIIQTDSYFHQVIVWSIEYSFSANEPVLRDMIASVRETAIGSSQPTAGSPGGP